MSLPGAAQPISQLFAAAEDVPPITLATLAMSLGIPLFRLIPLAQHGYLTLRSEGDICGDSYVDSLPEPAILWLRGWFLPPRAKPLFAMSDIMELMKLSSKRILALAAAHDIPTIYDEALGGHLFSAWATKRMLMLNLDVAANKSGRGPGQRTSDDRFDRQALLWRVMEGDPARLRKMPPWQEKLEEEIERVAKLDEPMRGIRSRRLADAFRDVAQVGDALGNSEVAEELRQVGLRLVS